MRSTAEFRAEIDLAPSDSGGLQDAHPSPTTSMVLGFGAAYMSRSLADDSWFGAEIRTEDGEPLRPGTRQEVTVRMWAVDEALARVAHNARFQLWYGRIVGQGVVLTQVERSSG